MRILILFISVTSLTFTGCAAQLQSNRVQTVESRLPEPKQAIELRFSLELKDGSRLIGPLSLKQLPVRTAFAKMDLPMDIVDSITFSKPDGTAIITCANGDQFHATLLRDDFVVRAAFGSERIPLSMITRIHRLLSSNTNGLLLDFSFDVDDGITVNDSTDNGNVGKLQGARLTPDGHSRSAVEFEGAADALVVTEKSNLDAVMGGQHPMSVALWIWRRTRQGDALFIRGADPFCCLCHFSADDPSKLFFYFKNGTDSDSIRVYASGFDELYQWQSIVITYDGSGQAGGVQIYKNGEAQPMFTWENGLRGAVRETEPLTIGAYRSRAGLNWFYKGRMDDFMLFNRKLSPEEVRHLARPNQN